VNKPRPIAYQSPLWPHLEEIRSWRRARKTWREITLKLRADYGIVLTLQAVQSFFKSATKRGEKLPLGFEPLPAATQPIPQKEPANASQREPGSDPFLTKPPILNPWKHQPSQ